MDEKKLEQYIEIYKREYSSIAPKAAERALKLDLLRLRNLPRVVDGCLEEATKAYIFGTFLASIVVCRMCLEAILKAKHPKRERNLETLVNKCKIEGILPTHIAEKAHKLRELGNKYVHMMVDKIANDLVQDKKVRRFNRPHEDLLLIEIGKEEDALKANTLLRDIVEYLYSSSS